MGAVGALADAGDLRQRVPRWHPLGFWAGSGFALGWIWARFEAWVWLWLGFARIWPTWLTLTRIWAGSGLVSASLWLMLVHYGLACVSQSMHDFVTFRNFS